VKFSVAIKVILTSIFCSLVGCTTYVQQPIDYLGAESDLLLYPEVTSLAVIILETDQVDARGLSGKALAKDLEAALRTEFDGFLLRSSYQMLAESELGEGDSAELSDEAAGKLGIALNYDYQLYVMPVIAEEDDGEVNAGDYLVTSLLVEEHDIESPYWIDLAVKQKDGGSLARRAAFQVLHTLKTNGQVPQVRPR